MSITTNKQDKAFLILRVLDQFVKTWITGDPNATRTTGYTAANVAQYLSSMGVNVSANTPIGQIDATKLATAVAHFETGYTPGGSSQLGSSTIDNLVRQVLSNPQTFNNLSNTQQTAVTARMAQLNIPIPSNIKPPSDTQSITATYALRLQQSGQILDSLSSGIVGYNPLGFETQIRLPSYLQSDQIQSYMQAARNFINSVLRRESGAVISESEFNNAYQQYLPRPGDSQTVLAQKKANRNAVLQGFISGAGPAWSNTTTLLQQDGSTQSVDLSDLNFSF